jgi:flagellar basal-body rod protein FlgC
MSIGTIALSGLQAAGKRLDVSANNTANVSSTVGRDAAGVLKNEPYRAQRVQQSSLVPTGVRTRVVDDANPTVRVYNPADPAAAEDGTVEVPNVALDEEVVQQNIAGYDFNANLKVLKTQDELLSNLLDIQA